MKYILAVILLFSFFAQAQQDFSDRCNDAYEGASLTRGRRSQVCVLVNDARSDQGFRPLRLDASLSRIAQRFAEDMAERDYFSHVSPEGRDLEWRLRHTSYPSLAGENIAWGYVSAEAVMNGWMNSYGHRANILKAVFSKMGVGYADKYWVQIFTD